MVSNYVESPRGVSVLLHAREDTTDLATIGSTFRLWGKLVDEYDLANLRSDGLMVDVGAHIGTVAIAFLIDNPQARAVAVEPLPENIDVLRMNAESVANRLTIIQGAFGTATIAYGPDVHRYIGNIGTLTKTGSRHDRSAQVVKVKKLTLSGIVKEHGPIDILKADCEGCEWSLFKDPAIRDVGRIIGEYHYKGVGALDKLLGKTHVITADGGDTGNFVAVRR